MVVGLVRFLGGRSQVVDAGDRGFGAIEAEPNHHGKPRGLRGLLLENIVHGTFLGENGGR